MKDVMRIGKINSCIFILSHGWLADIAASIGLNAHLANIGYPTWEQVPARLSPMDRNQFVSLFHLHAVFPSARSLRVSPIHHCDMI